MIATIIYNKSKDNDDYNLSRLVLYLKKYSVKCNIIILDKIMELKCDFDKSDIIITLGGDGTVMYAAQYSLKYGIPIIGINIGRLGFLTQINMDSLDLLSKFFEGNYIEEERMALEINVYGKDDIKNYCCVNDIVIARRDIIRLIDLDLYCDDKLAFEYRADGIIISTPTGSTAYSLSAGGPIVDSDMHGLIVTPISPHSLKSRVVVFSSEKEIKVVPKSDFDIMMSVDGNIMMNIDKNNIIKVKMSDKSYKFINFNDRNFLRIFECLI